MEEVLEVEEDLGMEEVLEAEEVLEDCVVEEDLGRFLYYPAFGGSYHNYVFHTGQRLGLHLAPCRNLGPLQCPRSVSVN